MKFLSRFKQVAKSVRTKLYTKSILKNQGYLVDFPVEGIHGVRLPMDQRFNEQSFSLTWRYCAEPGKRKILTELIRNYFAKGTTFIDVGCYIGDNSLPIALIADTDEGASICEVLAIDPCAENIEFIEAAAKLNKVKINTLVAVASNQESFYKPIEDLSHSEFVSADSSSTDSIRSIVLDTYVSSAGLGPVSVIHVDVEGMEYAVLSGASELLRRDRPIVIFEIHLRDKECQRPIELMKSSGYKVFTINEILELNHCDCRNIIAIPIEKVEKVLEIVEKLNFEKFENWYPVHLGQNLIEF